MLESFKKSSVNLPVVLKMKTTELILKLMKDRKNFGLFIILGWQNKWQNYTDISDSTQDIFAKRHVNVAEIENHTDWYGQIESTVGFDGAILINSRGDIIHSGIMIEGLRPRAVANKVNPGRFRDLSDQFGFKRKVHTRHLSAITASYIFKNTTVFTVSEEANDFHVYEAGKIIYSIP